MDVVDNLAIGQLLALYGHIIDDRQWERMEELFTADLIYDASDFGEPVFHGIEALRIRWKAFEHHPAAHHTTNVVITAGDGDTADVVSKGLGVGKNGRVGSCVYQDVVRKGPEGWRMARRIVLLRRQAEAASVDAAQST